MGYIDFDGIRYWDLREQELFDVVPSPDHLASDSRLRIDSIALLQGDVDQAQANKEQIERVQRNDRKLREEAEKRRHEGGPKYMV